LEPITFHPTNYMKSIIAAFLMLLSQSIYGSAYYTVRSGNFSATTTWNLGIVPSLGGDTWSNAPGFTLIYDVNNQTTSGWGPSTNNGFLVMTNLPCYLLMNGNLSGNGTNLIGSATTPVPFTSSNTPMCYIQFTNSAAQLTMIGTNSMPMSGTPHLTNMYLSAAAQLGATSITVSNVPSWLAVNDVLWMAPTNTTQGQGGEYYMVSSVAGRVINFLSVAGTGNTNFYPGMTFVSSVPTTSRPVGTQIAVLSCSVVFLEMQQRTISTITAILTNTIIGVTLQNLGRGLANTGCSGWTASYNTANNCSFGGLAYNLCAGWTASYNTANNCSFGGLAYNSCPGWTASYNTANNCNYGGLAYNYCSGWTASYNTANNCNNGGLANNSCSGWTASYNTANNCYAGGLANNSCSGWTASYNTANNCNAGGLANNGCSGWTASYNTANNCNNGGLANNSCSGWTASYNTNINSGALFISCWSIIATQSPSTNDTIGGTASFYSTIQFDNTIWIDPAGSVTNNNGTYVHSCSSGNSNNPVPLTIQFSVRPGAYRNILIATQATNNVQYYAAVSQGMTPPLPLSLVNSGNNLGNWTNTVLTYTNNSAFPIIANVWVASQGGVSSNGYSTVQLGQDVVVNKY
jgi:hypothetical protein